MASASIRRRKTRSGETRFQVRYRLGGRAYPLVHGGSFPTMKEARARRDLIGGELAAGRNPAESLRALTEAPQRRTFRDWAEAYRGKPRRRWGGDAGRPCGSHLLPSERGLRRPRPAVDHRRPTCRRGSLLLAWA